MLKIITVDGQPVIHSSRSVIEDAVTYLIDILDRQDEPNAEMEPDADGEYSDAGDDQSWAEWRPKAPIKRFR
jgi:hypothetical protein